MFTYKHLRQMWNKASWSSAFSTAITLQISEIGHVLIKYSLFKMTWFNMSLRLYTSPWDALMPYITLFLMGDILSVPQHKVRITFTIHYHYNENPHHGFSHFRKNSITSPEKQMTRNFIIQTVKHLSYTHKHFRVNIHVKTNKWTYLINNKSISFKIGCAHCYQCKSPIKDFFIEQWIW
jgi:hypothetical protein